MNKNLLVSLGSIVASMLMVLAFNASEMFLSFSLVVLALLKHRVLPIRKELSWYLLILTGGALVEIVLVNIGNAWTYTNPQFLGIPIYMPLFWGVIGTAIISFYHEFEKE